MKKNVTERKVLKTRVIIWVSVLALLVAAAVIAAVVLSRDDEPAPTPAPAQISLEAEFLKLRDSGVIVNYYVSKPEDIADAKELIKGFEGEIVSSVSGFKDELSVYVHELESEADAALAYELIQPTLASETVSRVDGRFLIFGSPELVNSIKF